MVGLEIRASMDVKEHVPLLLLSRSGWIVDMCNTHRTFPCV